MVACEVQPTRLKSFETLTGFDLDPVPESQVEVVLPRLDWVKFNQFDACCLNL